uniref:Uncharacterized protein n=1 Tax=Pelusios castaneus TaxID=367368 RepID=A0A8C8S593_9SAUR
MLGARGERAAAHISLSRVIAWHRQLVLQLGGTADSPQLREELQERRTEAHEGTDARLRQTGLRQPLTSPEERQELERLWVLFLSAVELFHQDLCRAQYLCQLFPLRGPGVQRLSTGLTGKATDGGHKTRRRASHKRKRSTEQLGAGPSLGEQIEHVGAMLLEMETRVSVPVWTVEATEEAWPESSAACHAERILSPSAPSSAEATPEVLTAFKGALASAPAVAWPAWPQTPWGQARPKLKNERLFIQ